MFCFLISGKGWEKCSVKSIGQLSGVGVLFLFYFVSFYFPALSPQPNDELRLVSSNRTFS